MKLCAIEPKELEEKLLIRFADNQNDELLEDLSDYVINSQKEIERLNNNIKEVREYIEEMQVYDYEFNEYVVQVKELLEILEKENNNGNN